MDSGMTSKTEISFKRGISGSTLKIIAIAAMIIDHVAAALLFRLLVDPGNNVRVQELLASVGSRNLMSAITIMRSVGRIAFPIFCFLMVEGFGRTHDKRKYALRMGIFALVSEIPFDLAFSSKVLEFSYQNIFFTLFLGLLAMIVADSIDRRVKAGMNKTANAAIRILLIVLVTAVFAGAAEYLHTDYAGTGVVCIMVLYMFRRYKAAQIAAGCVSFLWELPAPLAFLPIAFYNGRRGLKLKYVFYLFYPVHLLIIYLICAYLGVSWISVV